MFSHKVLSSWIVSFAVLSVAGLLGENPLWRRLLGVGLVFQEMAATEAAGSPMGPEVWDAGSGH